MRSFILAIGFAFSLFHAHVSVGTLSSPSVRTENGLTTAVAMNMRTKDMFYFLVQYDRHGKLNNDFGQAGVVELAKSPTSSDYPFHLAAQKDGKFVLGGYRRLDATNVVGLVLRLHPNGSTDNSFGAGGKVMLDLGGTNYLETHDVTVDRQGRILVSLAGSRSKPEDRILMVRLLPNGALDPTFGDKGFVIDGIQPRFVATKIIELPDGRIVVGGTGASADTTLTLVAYTPEGRRATNFGTNGVVSTELAAGVSLSLHSLALQEDGYILAGGTLDPQNTECKIAVVLARYRRDGTLDTGFGKGGLVSDYFGAPTSHPRVVFPQADGTIVAVGNHLFGKLEGSTCVMYFRGYTVAKYRANGTLATDFAQHGFVTLPLRSGLLLGATTGPSGTIQAYGMASVSPASMHIDFVAVQYLPNGQLDPTFGHDGILTLGLVP